MPCRFDDTIVAVASPPGGAARGILRLSGPEVRNCVEEIFQSEGRISLASIAKPKCIPGSIRLACADSRLPCELYLWPTERSYTGQPVAELHTLGSRPLLEAVLGTLCAAGARLAEPGEFTLRAFLAGRIDLTRAEAVLGVIDAADPRQLDVALDQLSGGLARPLDQLRNQLLDTLAHLEAGFDFPDEDLPFIRPDRLQKHLAEAADAISKLAGKMTSRGEAANATRAVLVGWPNTGKSSLFNALSCHNGALVSQHPGTTRDYLTAQLNLQGIPCELIDTAGVEPVSGGPAAELREAAQSLSRQQSRQAQVQILCLDSTRPLNAWERSELDRNAGAQRIVVLTKIDAPRATNLPQQVLETSSVTGQGIDALRTRLWDDVVTAGASGVDVVAGTAARCRESLRLAAECLNGALKIAASGTGEELVAAEVRVALDQLGKVVGTVYTEDILDRIFSRFCIGK